MNNRRKFLAAGGALAALSALTIARADQQPVTQLYIHGLVWNRQLAAPIIRVCRLWMFTIALVFTAVLGSAPAFGASDPLPVFSALVRDACTGLPVKQATVMLGSVPVAGAGSAFGAGAFSAPALRPVAITSW